MPDSRVSADIETKVVMLLEWVLCQKHMPHCSAAVRMTMRFLKQENGMFVEGQSTQPHSKEPTNINNSFFAAMGPSATSSAYASAAIHLATPPMSPVTLAQRKAYQDHLASRVTKSFGDGIAQDYTFQVPQQSPFVFHMDEQIKTEPDIKFHHANSEQPTGSNAQHASGKQDVRFDVDPKEKQPVPYGFHVRKPSKTGHVSGAKSAKKHQNTPVESQSPTGSAVYNSASEEASTPKPTNPQPSFGFGVRERVRDHTPATQPCLPKTPNSQASTHSRHRDSFAAASQTKPGHSTRSEVDELVEKLKAAELRNENLEERFEVEKETLEDKMERILSDNRRLLAANIRLLDAKKGFEAKYRDAQARLVEMEDEAEGLEADLDDCREHIVSLEEDLATSRRPGRGVW